MASSVGIDAEEPFLRATPAKRNTPLAAALTLLELKGLAKSVGPGSYVRC